MGGLPFQPHVLSSTLDWNLVLPSSKASVLPVLHTGSNPFLLSPIHTHCHLWPLRFTATELFPSSPALTTR